jgi:hypothetical protein
MRDDAGAQLQAAARWACRRHSNADHLRPAGLARLARPARAGSRSVSSGRGRRQRISCPAGRAVALIENDNAKSSVHTNPRRRLGEAGAQLARRRCCVRPAAAPTTIEWPGDSRRRPGFVLFAPDRRPAAGAVSANMRKVNRLATRRSKFKANGEGNQSIGAEREQVAAAAASGGHFEGHFFRRPRLRCLSSRIFRPAPGRRPQWAAIVRLPAA